MLTWRSILVSMTVLAFTGVVNGQSLSLLRVDNGNGGDVYFELPANSSGGNFIEYGSDTGEVYAFASEQASSSGMGASITNTAEAWGSCTLARNASALYVEVEAGYVHVLDATTSGPGGAWITEGSYYFGAVGEAAVRVQPATGVTKGLLKGTTSVILTVNPSSAVHHYGLTQCGTVSISTRWEQAPWTIIGAGATELEVIYTPDAANFRVDFEEVVAVNTTPGFSTYTGSGIGCSTAPGEPRNVIGGGSVLAGFEVEAITSGNPALGVTLVTVSVDEDTPYQVYP